MSARFLLSGVLLGVTALSLSAASIGVSFNSDRDNTPMISTTVAGVVPSTGWVSTDGGADAVAGASGSIVNSGVTVNWTSNGTWNTGNGVATGDAMLMNGFVDAIGADGAAQIVLSDLSSVFAGAYDVYVYFGSDGNGRTGQVAGPGATYSYSTFSADPDGSGGFDNSDYAITTDTGAGNPNANYALFSGLTGDTQTFDIIRGSSNSGFHGVQIIGDLIPEPTVSLLALGGLLVVFRRRR